MSHCARQLRFALRERANVNHMSSWYDWDDEARYLAGLLIAGEYGNELDDEE